MCLRDLPLRYAPFFANTGFYFARSNERTGQFFSEILFAYDLVLAWQDDQAVVCQFMLEHFSRTGLGIKILSQYDVPGGRIFQKEKPYMRQIVRQEVTPYAFHMHWTFNSAHKKRNLLDLGYWSLKTQCDVPGLQVNMADATFVQGCCNADGRLTPRGTDWKI